MPTTDAHAVPTRVERVLQVLVVLITLNLLVQFISAGRLFPQGGPELVHSAGAIVLHVLSGLAALAAVLAQRAGRVPVGVPVLAVVVFVATFVQAAVGGRSTLWVHVPGAMVLTAGTVWLLVWVLRPAGRR